MKSYELDYKVPNGKLIRLKANLDCDRICSVTINGDFFLHPEDRILTLERSLVGKTLEKVTLQKTAETALKGCQMAGVSPKDFVDALLRLKETYLRLKEA